MSIFDSKQYIRISNMELKSGEKSSSQFRTQAQELVEGY
jgi:hypothetical protein